ncbi:MAG: GNAT family N-acetyltransferase [Bacteroidetes bacterium]|nr:GNAT family N-acetyltransferase [Bacteroidota bacterium]MBL0078154.1 GNAT family N-acetyltransferase [Bacteroidota bacterium]
MELAKTYKIETERLIIRCYDPKDASKLDKSVKESVEHLLPWMPWAKDEPEDLSIKIARLRRFRGLFDLGQDYIFGIFDKTEQQLIGGTGLHTRIEGNAREIGYWINGNQINKGYATETVSALTQIGFEIENLDWIEIHCDPANLFSMKIPQKLGYELIKTLKNHTKDTYGNWRDTMVWSINKTAYQATTMKNIKLKAFDILGNRIEY